MTKLIFRISLLKKIENFHGQTSPKSVTIITIPLPNVRILYCNVTNLDLNHVSLI